MFIINGLQRGAYGLSLAGAVAGTVGILLIVAVIVLEIVLRTFFATSTFMMDELVGYLIAAVGFLPLGYTFAQRGVLRVNLLLDNIKNHPRLRLAVELTCVLSTLVVIGFLDWYFFANVARQYSRGYSSGTMSGIPQWIPTGGMLLGLVIFWIQVLSYGVGIVLGQKIQTFDEGGETAIN